ncbi:7244_t:CDS:2, partial [Scutellospora calospora]
KKQILVQLEFVFVLNLTDIRWILPNFAIKFSIQRITDKALSPIDFFIVCKSYEFPNALKMTIVLEDHIVSSNLCDSEVEQYSGYINIASDANMFFWFFESRHDPKNSPLTIWLSGGPGFSSMFALFQEARPCEVIANTTKTIRVPNGWNEVTNLLFIDQPIGAGFSYGSRLVNTTEQCASDIYEFLQKFFIKFPKYATLDLYLFSESYGGHYVPIMATLIVQNNNLIRTGKIKDKILINLKSCGIGGPWVSPLITMKSYVNYIENNTYNTSLLSPELIEDMRNKWIPCQQK